MKLYEIETSYQRLADMIDEGLIDADAIADTFEALDGEFEVKADSIACLLKTWKAEAEAIKAEVKLLDERVKRKEKQAESLKNYLSDTMQRLGKSKLETSRNVLSFRKSTALTIVNESEFMRKYPQLVFTEVKQTLPKKDITDRLKAGEVFEGAELVIKQNIQIK